MYKKNRLNVLLAIFITTAFIMPITVFADNEKHVDNSINTESHTVFAEFATATTCGYCKYAHAALKTIYATGDYPFYYVSLVCDKNSEAYTRAKNDYNFYGYPTVFFDGGYKVNLGGGTNNEAQYRSSIDSCINRDVSNIYIDIAVAWLGGTEMKIDVSVNNNEISEYNGIIRVYITEIESSMGWKDTAGYLYTFPFLDYAFNEEISIPAEGIWSDSTTWDGASNGFPTITEDNIMIIAAVFNDEWHQGYAYPPSGNPFDAYYVDETAAAMTNVNHPPNKPDTPSGPTSGIVGVEYTYTSSTTDIDGDDVYYMWNWGDGPSSKWFGPYNSGDTTESSHTWDDEGIYDVRVKARDVYSESVWSSDPLTVHIGDVPIIKIGDITGGLFKINAVIKNIGSADATCVDWSIALDGGFILLGKETTGSIVCIPAGDEATISSGLILGFGKTVITVTADIPESFDTKDADARIFLFFIKINY